MVMKKEKILDIIESTGDMPAVASMDAVAVFDPEDGRVVHLHHVLTFKGAKRTTVEQQQKHALDYARRLGCKVEGLATLHVPDFQPAAGRCCVDLERKVLVEMPVPPAIRKRLRPC